MPEHDKQHISLKMGPASSSRRGVHDALWGIHTFLQQSDISALTLCSIVRSVRLPPSNQGFGLRMTSLYPLVFRGSPQRSNRTGVGGSLPREPPAPGGTATATRRERTEHAVTPGVAGIQSGKPQRIGHFGPRFTGYPPPESGKPGSASRPMLRHESDDEVAVDPDPIAGVRERHRDYVTGGTTGRCPEQLVE